MPIITLTSDIGQQDFFVGAVKGQLLQVNPAFNIVDISHQLLPHNILNTAYTLKGALCHFPPKTLHLVLVGLFEKTPTQLLLIKHNEQFIACANNGTISMILDELPKEYVVLPFTDNLPVNTINCVRRWAVAFEELNNGKSITDLGSTNIPIAITNALRPILKTDCIEVQILYIDNYENIILNITEKEFEAHRDGRNFKIEVRRDEFIESISENYGAVADGEKLAIFNAVGYLEIAVKKGNAASLMGFNMYVTPEGKANKHAQNKIPYNLMKIHFVKDKEHILNL